MSAVEQMERRKTVVLDEETWEKAQELMRKEDRSLSSLVRRLLNEKHEETVEAAEVSRQLGAKQFVAPPERFVKGKEVAK